jgi:hypothetical protein
VGSPAHLETFQLELADYLPVTSGGGPISFMSNDPAVEVCTPCNSSPVPALHFLRGSSSELIQFADLDGTTRLYEFPLPALSEAGSYHTLPGINTNQGDLAVVATTPEPSTMGLFAAGIAALVWRSRRRKRIF